MLEKQFGDTRGLNHSSSTANECKVNADANELKCFEIKVTCK